MCGLNEGVDNGESVPVLFQHPPPCPHLLSGQGQAGIQGFGWAGEACYGSISTSSPPFQKEADGVLRKGGRAQPGSPGSPEPASSLHFRPRNSPLEIKREPSLPPVWVGREAFLGSDADRTSPGCSRWDWSQERQCLFTRVAFPGTVRALGPGARRPPARRARSVLAERRAMYESKLGCSGFTSVDPT